MFLIIIGLIVAGTDLKKEIEPAGFCMLGVFEFAFELRLLYIGLEKAGLL